MNILNLSEEEKRYWHERDFVVELLKQLPMYVFWKNRDSVYLGCNDIFAIAAGLSSAEEIIGKTDYDLQTTREESDAYRADDKEVMDSGLPKLNIEEAQTLPDGRKIVLLTSKVPLIDKRGQIIGVLGIYTDISDRKRIEEDLTYAKEKAEAASKAKSAFILSMSHDVRTPLSGVIGMSDLLESQGDTKKDRDYGRVIHSSSERLLSLLNDILEVAATDDVKENKLKLTTFCLQERVEHIKELVSSNARIKNIQVKTCIDPKMTPYIVSDRVKFDRLLLNLVSNALKFTSEGAVSINIKLLSRKGQQAKIEIEVSDTGIGIAEDKIDKIFECFYRTDQSVTKKFEGYGIGLFIVQKYVSMMGGKISVESKLGTGTTFRIELKVRVGKEEELETKKDFATIYHEDKQIIDTHVQEVSTKKNTANYLKALIVDDDEVARKVVSMFFEAVGFEIEAMGNAEMAFKCVMEKKYNLIVTDIGLPDMDGNEFTELVRAWQKANRLPRIPIIGLSAHGEYMHEESMAAGMNGLITKPINKEKIQKVVDMFFK